MADTRQGSGPFPPDTALVTHDPSLVGAGTPESPLGVAGGLLGGLITWIAVASLDSTTGLYANQVGFVGNPTKNNPGDWTLQLVVASVLEHTGIDPQVFMHRVLVSVERIRRGDLPVKEERSNGS